MSSSQLQTSNSCVKPVSAPVAFSFHIYVSRLEERWTLRWVELLCPSWRKHCYRQERAGNIYLVEPYINAHDLDDFLVSPAPPPIFLNDGDRAAATLNPL
ncbi:hypothetical protein P8452_61747 [Trifolium repens]|nr:hypothetical protein P8452_61747 [Trifolium repens]